MKNIEFVWDESKAAGNKKKHGVTFTEAQSVFYDDSALESYDPDHSGDEDRFIMLGMSYQARVLVVCHCIRENDSIIRIISARKATSQERKKYDQEKL